MCVPWIVLNMNLIYIWSCPNDSQHETDRAARACEIALPVCKDAALVLTWWGGLKSARKVCIQS